MRRLIVSLLLLLAAYQREKSFDERYKAAQEKLAGKSAAIDRELDAAASDAAAADAVVPGAESNQ